MLWRGRIVAGVGGALGVVILRCLLGFVCEPSKTQRGSSYGCEPSKTQRGSSYGCEPSKTQHETTL